ncbi:MULTISPECIES: TOMM precursor leader peptide-binding protein [unclassified Leifsonia]|uniref:TOMM precursor leader peptide-binding protein n=1 Tax=unclassified Leifsonia TaxID=2663824 RepID=UPI0025BBA30F|nr:TOMM precursor leader peptide-binding protein [Leifsonia sp. 71-9]
MREQLRYSIAPQIHLGVAPDVVFAFDSESATRVAAPGIVPFVSGLNESLTSASEGLELHEIASRLGASVDQVEPILDRLVDLKMLVRHTAKVSTFAKLAEASAGGQLAAHEIQANIDTCRVGMKAPEGSLLSQAIATSLVGLGIAVGEPDDADFVIVIGESLIDPTLFDFNRRALEAEGAPWLAVAPFDGGNAWVGPFHIPKRSACYTCFRLRRSANFPDEKVRDELLELRGLTTGPTVVAEHPISLVQAGVAANLVSEWVALRQYAPSAAPGALTTISLDGSGISMRWHRTLRVPRCPDCSTAAEVGMPQTWFHDEAGISSAERSAEVPDE